MNSWTWVAAGYGLTAISLVSYVVRLIRREKRAQQRLIGLEDREG